MPYTKDQARTEIAKLVSAFKASEARLQAEAEAQIENNYIRPLFRFLNWNTENSGLAVADYEFVVQRTDRYGKRPDYILQLDGQHLLVMDAKQVKHDMHDPRWMNQVYAYAYSTQNLPPSRKIDFAVLTDFQELVVLDCTLYAGDPKVVGNFRVLDWTCDDYVTQFETLWELFERENLREAAATRVAASPAGLWARYLSPKKVKANRIPPDKSFLAEMDDDKNGWRVRLAKDMKKRNPGADGALITAAVQLLIDRLIFVKALSDREIEDDYLAQLAETVERDGLAESDAGWFTACRAIFDRLNQFYNGSIFEPRPELEAVTVSNKVVREVLRALQPENSPYNFAVLPVEILGTIYERFLGRVVRTTEKQVKIEDKPEVRKAGGVYYTPQYIVDYIVQNTVGKLLEDCNTPEDVARLKIADPACGSGSFLLGAYSALIDWHVRYYGDKERLTKKDRAAVYYDSDGSARLTAQLKRQILLNNLFGVDIDAQAVEVTRFSLSLKALEDTRHDELYEERDLFKQTVLPDLRHNIKHGNSLIGPDYFAGQMFSNPDELRRVNPFDWEREFPQVFAATPDGAATPDRFPKNLSGVAGGGFDAVIGNPPYRRELDYKELMDEIAQASIGKKYRSPRMDLWYYFVHRGLELTKPSGLLSYIVNAYWVSGTGAEKLISTLRDSAYIEEIFFFGKLKVFQNVSGQHMIIRARNEHNSNAPTLIKVADDGIDPTAESVVTGRIPVKTFSKTHQQLFRNEKVDIQPPSGDLLAKIEQWAPLETKGIIRQGIAENPASINRKTNEKYGNKYIVGQGVFALRPDELKKLRLPASEKKLVHPYHDLKDLGRYYLASEPSLFLIYSTRNTCPDIRKFPTLYGHLLQFKPVMQERRETKKGANSWWHLHWPRDESLWTSSKVVSVQMGVRPSFTLSTTPVYVPFSANVFVPHSTTGEHLNYLLGLLNSRVMWHWYKHHAKRRGVGLEINGNVLSRTPIRPINFADPADKARHDKMVGLVESMLALHTHKAAARTQAEQDLYQRQIEATDRAIDGLVYELYGLTAEEIAVVEGR